MKWFVLVVVALVLTKDQFPLMALQWQPHLICHNTQQPPQLQFEYSHLYCYCNCKYFWSDLSRFNYSIASTSYGVGCLQTHTHIRAPLTYGVFWVNLYAFSGYGMRIEWAREREGRLKVTNEQTAGWHFSVAHIAVTGVSIPMQMRLYANLFNF